MYEYSFNVERCIDHLIIFNLFLRKQNKITRGKRKTEFFEKISWNLITFVAIKTKMLKISYSEEESREFPRLQYSQSEYSHQGENFTISNSPLVAYTFLLTDFHERKGINRWNYTDSIYLENRFSFTGNVRSDIKFDRRMKSNFLPSSLKW